MDFNNKSEQKRNALSHVCVCDLSLLIFFVCECVRYILYGMVNAEAMFSKIDYIDCCHAFFFRFPIN